MADDEDYQEEGEELEPGYDPEREERFEVWRVEAAGADLLFTLHPTSDAAIFDMARLALITKYGDHMDHVDIDRVSPMNGLARKMSAAPVTR